jgi:predicted N-formylglutamate amidohydrolase
VSAPELIAGRAGRGILIIADHASNATPGIALGVAAQHMVDHIAWDIGTAALARGLAARLESTAVLATASRLVVDLNRAPGEAIPEASDGVAVPANRGLDDAARASRLAAYYVPYHDAVARLATSARLIVSVHSFTPALASRPEEARPWHVGLLYNRDDRAAQIAMRLLAAEGLTVGDNLPYSGAVYGYTTDRHAEAGGIPYLTFEVRQDLLADAAMVEQWTERLARVVDAVEAELFSEVETLSP